MLDGAHLPPAPVQHYEFVSMVEQDPHACGFGTRDICHQLHSMSDLLPYLPEIALNAYKYRRQIYQFAKFAANYRRRQTTGFFSPRRPRFRPYRRGNKYLRLR